jgi:sulfide:quinone oxidoreductase
MKAKVVIVGGGVASLEATLALREILGEEVAIDVYSPRQEFVYRPYAVGEPYGTARVKTYDLEEVAPRAGAGFHLDSVVAVDPSTRLVTTHDGVSVPYDYLLLAPGATMLWPVPGARTFWGIADEGTVEDLLEEIRGGEVRSVAFTSSGSESWALPMYELALLAEARLAADGVGDVRLTIVTPEDSPLQLFGRVASGAVAALLADRGIEVATRRHPVRFENGFLETAPGEPMAFDQVVSLPRLEGRRIRGIGHDPEGFLRVDDHCRALGKERIYAAGDVTNYPVKQGGIAAQQADLVAESIAFELGAAVEPEPFDPILRGVLWTGHEPRYLQGWLGGGHGELSVMASQPPWDGGGDKIVAPRLSSFLAEVDASAPVAAGI